MRIGEAMNSDGACSKPAAEHVRALIVNFRLSAAGRASRTDDSCRRNRPLAVLQVGRPLYLQLQSLNGARRDGGRMTLPYQVDRLMPTHQ